MSVEASANYKPATIAFFTAGAGAALGSFGAYIFTTISPVTGAIFGATFSVVDLIAQPLFEKFLGIQGDTAADFIAWAASITVSALATKAIMSLAFGIVLSGEATALLAASSVAAPYVVAIALLAAAAVLAKVCFNWLGDKPPRHFHTHL